MFLLLIATLISLSKCKWTRKRITLYKTHAYHVHSFSTVQGIFRCMCDGALPSFHNWIARFLALKKRNHPIWNFYNNNLTILPLWKTNERFSEWLFSHFLRYLCCENLSPSQISFVLSPTVMSPFWHETVLPFVKNCNLDPTSAKLISKLGLHVNY